MILRASIIAADDERVSNDDEVSTMIATRSRTIATLVLAVSACLLTTGFSVLPTVEHDASLPFVELNGYRFHAQAFGDADKPVIIVLHGGPGADYRYLLPLKALASDYRVVFYDQRGTGLSPRVPAKQITLDVFLSDLDAFVDAFGHGRPVHLVGHSWGAMLASAYVGAHPGKVDKLVLAEPGFLDASTADVFESGWPGMHVVWGFAKAWVGKWFVRTAGDAYARDDYFLLQVMPLMQESNERCTAGRLPPLQAWRFGSPNFEATIGRMRDDPQWAASLNFHQGVENFPGRTLFLAGQCSAMTGVAQQKRHIGHFAHATLEVVPEAGHFMFNDRPEQSLSRVRLFLSRDG
jgi:proline iminopeptidase